MTGWRWIDDRGGMIDCFEMILGNLFIDILLDFENTN